MLTVMQQFLVRPTSYSMYFTFKCQSTAVVLWIGSLGFSEFQHGARNPYQVVPDGARFFGKTLAPKILIKKKKKKWSLIFTEFVL